MNKDLSLKAMLRIVAAGFFMQTLDPTIVNTALPAIARDLHEPALNIQPIIVAYTLTMAMLLPASGWLEDRFGTRRVWLVVLPLGMFGAFNSMLNGAMNSVALKDLERKRPADPPMNS
jgi:DHA2 family multidrug resistance protein-like MFS transporter